MKPFALPPFASTAIFAILSTQAFAAVNMDYVTVGNPGNVADTTGYGAVAYTYQIGKYEVTNNQYVDFLNAKAASDPYSLYNAGMSFYGISRSGGSGSYTYSVSDGLGNHPVVLVSWYDAARFSNWLANGQGGGDTETGSYTLNGAMSGLILANPGANVRLPTEDEWYKAAYYSGSGSTYFQYPDGKNTVTDADANFDYSVVHSTDVGTYSGDPSPYGTFDQAGNAWEWNEAVVYGSMRVLRGGSWNDGVYFLSSTVHSGANPSFEDTNVGFRVASVAAVPEPSSLVLSMLASGMVFLRRRK